MTGQQQIFTQLCKQEGLPAPTPEYRFATDIGRKWRIDYYFEQNGIRVALEVEGGVWKSGRHNRASGFIKDIEKYNELARRGILLLRVIPDDLLKIKTMQLIKDTLNESQ